jgi:hypothetical protein
MNDYQDRREDEAQGTGIEDSSDEDMAAVVEANLSSEDEGEDEEEEEEEGQDED